MEVENQALRRWTKKDIKALCGQIDGFWLKSRPLSDSASEHAAAKARVQELLLTRRQDIVLAGVREFREMHARRYREYCETIGNQIVRFTEYGKPDDLIDRFTKLAREEDADAKHAEALVLRVVREGLPWEVLAYDPFGGR